MKLECDLREVFDTLSPKEKEVWELFIEGHSQAQIARQLGVCDQRVSQIKKKIRTRIWQADHFERWKVIARSEDA